MALHIQLKAELSEIRRLSCSNVLQSAAVGILVMAVDINLMKYSLLLYACHGRTCRIAISVHLLLQSQER